MNKLLVYTGLIKNLGIFENMQPESVFWYFLLITVVSQIISIAISSEFPFWAIVNQFISVITLFLYSQLRGDQYWFLDWGDGKHWFRWIIFFLLIVMFLGICFRTSWEYLKLIVEFFSTPFFSLICFILGIIWLITALSMIVPLFDYHSGAAFLIILTLFLPKEIHVPTIYVRGEGDITGHGYHGGDRFHGDNGNDYNYDGSEWHRS